VSPGVPLDAPANDLIYHSITTGLHFLLENSKNFDPLLFQINLYSGA